MNLSIDIGNTLVKFGVFSNNQLMTSGVINGRDFSKLKDVLVNHEIIHIVYAAVAEIPPELTSIFSNFSSVIRLDKNTSLPFQNKYLTPETLGNDRLANVCGAIALFPEMPNEPSSADEISGHLQAEEDDVVTMTRSVG